MGGTIQCYQRTLLGTLLLSLVMDAAYVLLLFVTCPDSGYYRYIAGGCVSPCDKS